MTTSASRFVVACDFGSTFSGFAYCRRDHPADIYVRYDWEDQVEYCAGTYCKTITALYYTGGGALAPAPAWGWPAVRKHFDTQQGRAGGPNLITRFKLLLADEAQRMAMFSQAGSTPDDGTSVTAANIDWAVRLPVGKTVEDCVADYLRGLSGLAMSDIRSKFGHHVADDDIQWCLTVPAIWDEAAKAAMLRAAAKAGMVKMNTTGAGSKHAPLLILEPEAASLYAFNMLRNGDLDHAKVAMVVDAGGGNVDVVVHKLESALGDPQMCEVCRGSGDLCGGVFVDKAFEEYLARRMPCYAAFKQQHPQQAARLMTDFDRNKRTFSGQTGDAWTLDLPASLSRMWAAEQGAGSNEGEDFDALEISCDIMKAVFGPVVNRTLHLMEKMLKDAAASGTPCDTILVGGGLSASPYLFARIKERFGRRVQHIVRPPADPDSAVIQGPALRSKCMG
eukprot:jgi/Mesvir1/20348/Mv19935-RA.1